MLKQLQVRYIQRIDFYVIPINLLFWKTKYSRCVWSSAVIGHSEVTVPPNSIRIHVAQNQCYTCGDKMNCAKLWQPPKHVYYFVTTTQVRLGE